MVSSLMRFFEKSRWRPAASATSRSPRAESDANKSRRWVLPISARWASRRFKRPVDGG